MSEVSYNEIERNTLREAVDGLLEEGYVFWEGVGIPPLSEDSRYYAVDVAGMVYNGPNKAEFAAACQSFYLFRALHSNSDEKGVNTLLGDYFFSQFSHNLIPLDSIPLIDAFADYLSKDTILKQQDYLHFINGLGEVINS